MLVSSGRAWVGSVAGGLMWWGARLCRGSLTRAASGRLTAPHAPAGHPEWGMSGPFILLIVAAANCAGAFVDAVECAGVSFVVARAFFSRTVVSFFFLLAGLAGPTGARKKTRARTEATARPQTT
jgi:hypothetical protein